jgi:glycosyltransferase involved in cell wall biosynthesis
MVIGSGECEAALKRQANGHPRVHFVASMNSSEVIDVLARTKIFFSGCDTEAFGISLLEAAVSGCNLVTTGSGGFVEVMLDAVNRTAFLLSPSFTDDECRAAFDAALAAPRLHLDAGAFLPEAIARKYLSIAQTTVGGRS